MSVLKFEDEMTEADIIRTDAEYEAHEARGNLDEFQATTAALMSSVAALTALKDFQP